MTFSFSIFDSFDLGVGTPADVIEQRLALAVEAERLGFDHYHVTEHHGTDLSTIPSPNLFLSALSQTTSRIRMGAMVYVLPSYEPLRLAEEIAVLDHFTGGRLEVGVGSGVSPYELAYFGVPAGEARDRYSRTLASLVDAWRTGVLTHPEDPQRPPATLSVLPVQRPYPPLWYASSNQRTAEWAGANGVNFIGRWNAGDLVPAIDAYWRAVRASDREDRLNPAQGVPHVGPAATVYIADSEAEAHDRFMEFGRFAWKRVVKLWHDHDDHASDAMMMPETMLERHTAIVGTADSVRDQIVAQIEQAEINFFEAQLYEGDMSADEAFENQRRFARIMPEIRDAAAAIQARRAKTAV